MAQNILLLGGTSEASALAEALAERGVRATLSYAGRVANPRSQPLPVRIGGFGGAAGLAAYLRATGTTHVIDATHPFAADISRNALAAAREAGIPLIALVRAPWHAAPEDRWTHVPDVSAAVAALAGPPRRVFLALGRLALAAFAAQPQHHYLLRLVDAPGSPPPLPRTEVILARGPFAREDDRRLLQQHRIELIVAKNAGGDGAVAKLLAARDLCIPVILIDRPALPPRCERATVGEVLVWLDHASAQRGV